MNNILIYIINTNPMYLLKIVCHRNYRIFKTFIILRPAIYRNLLEKIVGKKNPWTRITGEQEEGEGAKGNQRRIYRYARWKVSSWRKVGPALKGGRDQGFSSAPLLRRKGYGFVRAHVRAHIGRTNGLVNGEPTRQRISQMLTCIYAISIIESGCRKPVCKAAQKPAAQQLMPLSTHVASVIPCPPPSPPSPPTGAESCLASADREETGIPSFADRLRNPTADRASRGIHLEFETIRAVFLCSAIVKRFQRVLCFLYSYSLEIRVGKILIYKDFRNGQIYFVLKFR